jgi:hypothetical protein
MLLRHSRSGTCLRTLDTVLDKNPRCYCKKELLFTKRCKKDGSKELSINEPLASELNPSKQRCLPEFFLGLLNFNAYC